MVSQVGFEPTAIRFSVWHSTSWVTVTYIGKHVRFRQFYDPLFMTQKFVLLYTIAIDARWTVGSGLPSKQRAHIRLIIDFLNEIGRYFSLTSILFREFFIYSAFLVFSTFYLVVITKNTFCSGGFLVWISFHKLTSNCRFFMAVPGRLELSTSSGWQPDVLAKIKLWHHI